MTIPMAVARDGRTIYAGAASEEADVWMVERPGPGERR
jgi:hypothetical protein